MKSEKEGKADTAFAKLVGYASVPTATMFLELGRSSLVHTDNIPKSSLSPIPEKTKAVIGVDNPLYTPLSHMGDIFDGAFGSIAGMALMDTINTVQSKVTRRKFPRWVSAVAGTAIGTVLVLGAETHLLGGRNYDPLDIPAGIAGAMAPFSVQPIENTIRKKLKPSTL